MVEEAGMLPAFALTVELDDSLRKLKILDRIAHADLAHVYVYDLRRKTYVFVNRALIEFHGQSARALRSDPQLLNLSVHPDDLDLFLMRDGKIARTLEFRLRDREGCWRWFGGQVRVFSRVRGTGEPASVIGSFNDITSYKDQQQQLLTATRLAEASVRAKSEFLANMSHEIRTPLNSILGFSELLMDTVGRDAAAREYLGKIAQNGDLLLRLIDDILSLAQFEAGKIPITVKAFSLKDLVKELVEVNRVAATRKGLALELVGASCLPGRIMSDAGRIRQILNNLIGNAIKFTPSGEIRVSCRISGGKCVIDVADPGIGISRRDLPNLFKPFEQANASISSQYGGTGLGLALSQRLAEALGGRLWLTHTAVGQGSMFSFEIPLQKSRTAVVRVQLREKSARDTQPGLSGRRILVAEDSEDSGLLLRKFLESAGADVVVVTDGIEAMRLAVAEPFDAFILDIRLPYQNGFEVLKYLRAVGMTKPILASSAQAMDCDQQKILAAGFTGVVAKPVNRAELIQVLVEAMPAVVGKEHACKGKDPLTARV